MDIHKPRAAHSWREFAIEIGTIVCGIVIAIGLEQAVEWLHHEGELRETREALTKEQTTFTADLTRRLKEENEEVETANGELLGNYPQAFSHIGLIVAANDLDRARSART